jgi:hypothetical protein
MLFDALSAAVPQFFEVTEPVGYGNRAPLNFAGTMLPG